MRAESASRETARADGASRGGRPARSAWCGSPHLELLVCLLAGCGAGEPRPNVLLYVSDTLRADGLACYGNGVVETPNVDRFAAEGVLFERAIAPSSWTRAAMGSILSGTAPSVHGAQGRYDLLEESVVLMSELLRERGYATANVTTNRNVGDFFGFRQGYDADGFVELFDPSDDDMVKVEELTARAGDTTRAAIAWLESAPEPFFLLVHPTDPHSPYAPPEGWDRYGAGIKSRADGSSKSLKDLSTARSPADVQRVVSLYLGEIAYNDHAFGELLSWMRARGVLDRTIAVFTSDHGEEFWEHGERGHGKTLFEEALHVPLVVRYPGAVPAGRRLGQLVSTVDVLPTVFALAGLDPPAWVDGRSLLETPGEDPAVFASCLLQRMDLHVVRTERWKLVWDRHADRRMLFDLESDPRETKDVSARHPNVADELFARLVAQRDAEREKRIRLHGTPTARRVRESPEIDAHLDQLGYVGYDEGGDDREEDDGAGEEPR